MSWTIHLLENSVEIPVAARPELAVAIVRNSVDHFPDVDLDLMDPVDVMNEVFRNGKLSFDADDMEHMDYVCHNDAICKAIAAAGGTGRILFADLEGGGGPDRFWGMEFAEKHYSKLTATPADINWKRGSTYAA